VGWINFTDMRLILIMAVLFVLGCSEKRSIDANEVYKLWANQNPPKEVIVLNGQYWQSAHFTKEYIMFLELKATDQWRREFIKQNSLVVDSSGFDLPTDSPKWFKPDKSSLLWKPVRWDQGSRFYENTEEGILFIYDIQL
jgi:hypothetical protein